MRDRVIARDDDRARVRYSPIVTFARVLALLAATTCVVRGMYARGERLAAVPRRPCLRRRGRPRRPSARRRGQAAGQTRAPSSGCPRSPSISPPTRRRSARTRRTSFSSSRPGRPGRARRCASSPSARSRSPASSASCPAEKGRPAATDAAPLASSDARHGGPPYFFVAEVESPKAGPLRRRPHAARVRGRQGRRHEARHRRRVQARAARGPEGDRRSLAHPAQLEPQPRERVFRMDRAALRRARRRDAELARAARGPARQEAEPALRSSRRR